MKAQDLTLFFPARKSPTLETAMTKTALNVFEFEAGVELEVAVEAELGVEAADMMQLDVTDHSLEYT